MSELIGKKLGNYKILEKIGQGGMASVYRGQDLTNENIVAVKVLAPQLALDPSFRKRFEREAKVLRDLNHPNIVSILDYGQVNGVYYIVMPFVEVGGLNERLRKGALDPLECASIMTQIALALEYAHTAGVVHRDVKPSNILLEENGKVWLSDFGFAHVLDSSLSLTGSGLIGTPAYMAPELVSGESATPRSDQYSLGVLFYQMSTGRLPYEADTPIAVAVKQATSPLPRPRGINPGLPNAIEAILMKILAKEPEERFPSIAGFINAYQEALTAAYDLETGELKPGAIIKDTITEVFVGKSIDAMGKRIRRFTQQPIQTFFLIFMLAIPVLYWAISAFRSNDPPVDVDATITAIYVAVSNQSGLSMPQDEVQTLIAATMTAMWLSGEGGLGGSALGSEDDFISLLKPDDFDITPTPSATPVRLRFIPRSSPTTARVWVPSATPKPPKVDTPVPTFTPTPTRTYTPTPTFTFTPLPPTPTIDICAKLVINWKDFGDRDVKFEFLNNSSSGVMINSLTFRWPKANTLTEIKLGSKKLWQGSSNDAPITIDGIGESVGAGRRKEMKFKYAEAPQPSGHRVVLSAFFPSFSCDVRRSH
jgi:tRNA A-37 threonylcarbamoyl transferase component Bud32